MAPFEHVLFAVKEMRKVNKFGRSYRPGVALDQDLKCSIIDRIFFNISEGLSEGGEQVTGKIPRSIRQFANELRDRKHRKICMAQILRRKAKPKEA